MWRNGKVKLSGGGGTDLNALSQENDLGGLSFAANGVKLEWCERMEGMWKSEYFGIFSSSHSRRQVMISLGDR